MTVIWVAEDINKNGTFKQSKAEVLCTLSCLLFIKHYYPEYKTVFFVDQHTKKYYEPFGFLHLFDEVNETLLNQDVLIDKNVFWAAGKLMAQRITPGPTLTMDLDFWLFSDISVFGVFDSDVACLWVEEINDEYYHKPEIALNNSELDMSYEWDNYGLNVSFLYLKDEEFKNKYCDEAIDYMKSMYGKIPNNLSFDERTKYILFAEQYLLNQISKSENKRVKVLIDDFYDITKLNHIESVGINMNNCVDYLYHMGNHKHDYRKKNDFAKNGMKWFYQVTNSTITDNKFLSVFNKLYEKSEYEGCFC